MAPLSYITFTDTPEAPPEVSGYRVGIFPEAGGETPLATKDFTNDQVVSPTPGQLKIDLTAWGNSNPVPDGSYLFRLKALGAEGQESPWGEAFGPFEMSVLESPNATSVD